MLTSQELTREKLSVYRAAVQKRHEQEKAELNRRREKAWQAAQRAARLLREKFDASRVVVFGSLLRPTGFTQWSDVDIAAWGIAPENTFRAIGAVMDLKGEITVNLVDVDTVRPAFLAVIEQEGVEL